MNQFTNGAAARGSVTPIFAHRHSEYSAREYSDRRGPRNAPMHTAQSREHIAPQSLDAEQSTLGAMLMERDVIATARRLLGESDFYRESHRQIFSAIVSLETRGEPVDLITVVEELRRREQLEQCGGAAYITALIESCPSALNVESYARAVSEKARARQAQEIAYRLPQMLQSGADTSDALISAAIEQLSQLQQKAREERADDALPIKSIQELLSTQFPEPKWVVPGLVAEGLSILGGAPKLGKSWLALGLALATAGGTYALGKYPVEQGDVLYLALEDTYRRLQNRIVKLIEGAQCEFSFDMATQWPTQDAGGLEMLERWLSTHESARLVVIDTLEKFRPKRTANANMYGEDYAAISALKRLADTYGVAIIVVHHVAKQSYGDPLMDISGSLGITGSADATMVLKRKRTSGEGSLFITGRDVDEQELPLLFDEQLGMWNAQDASDGTRDRSARDAVLDVLREADEPLSPIELSEQLSTNKNAMRSLVWKMRNDGELSRAEFGKYTPGPNAPAPRDNRDVFDAPTSSREYARAAHSQNAEYSGNGVAQRQRVNVNGVNAVAQTQNTHNKNSVDVDALTPRNANVTGSGVTTSRGSFAQRARELRAEQENAAQIRAQQNYERLRADESVQAAIDKCEGVSTQDSFLAELRAFARWYAERYENVIGEGGFEEYFPRYVTELRAGIAGGDDA